MLLAPFRSPFATSTLPSLPFPSLSMRPRPLVRLCLSLFNLLLRLLPPFSLSRMQRRQLSPPRRHRRRFAPQKPFVSLPLMVPPSPPAPAIVAAAGRVACRRPSEVRHRRLGKGEAKFNKRARAEWNSREKANLKAGLARIRRTGGTMKAF